MKAISKKLLSLLVVIAMVLSMVPFGGLSIFAVETKAAETASTTVTPGQANLPEGISTTNPVDNSDAAILAHVAAGTCPMCNATGITWTAQTSTIAAGTSHNYYALKDGQTESTYTFANNTITLDGDDTICVAIMSGVTVKNTNWRSVKQTGNGNTLNIMGTGTMISDQVTNGKADYGVFQLEGGTADAPNTLNLYGGSYQHVTDQTDTTNEDQAIVRLKTAYITVNMWDGVVIGPETVDTTQWSENVRISAGTFNMYGGTIQNGVTQENAISGNVTVGGSGTFNMYGGTIKGGTYMGTTANTGGNVVVGGKIEKGTYSSAGTFKMYGGIIEGGKAYNSGNGGGNICCYNKASVMELWGGIVRDGWAKKVGGNVQIMDGTAHKIGGTVLITNGEAVNGGNIQIAASKKLTMEGGYITGGTLATSSQNAENGGAVYVAGTFDMNGGEIDGCTASNDGGNVYTASGATTNISGGTIQNGTATGKGGNIYFANAATLTGGTIKGGSAVNGGNMAIAASVTVTVNGANFETGTATSDGGSIYAASGATLKLTKGTISGGQTDTYGGNIHLAGATLTMEGGSVYDGYAASQGGNISGASNSQINISGGSVYGGSFDPAGSGWGGNIRAWNATVNISGGYIYDGCVKNDTNNQNAGNIGALGTSTLNISGGNIGGDIVYVNGNLTLSGAPKIKYSGLTLEDGTTAPNAEYVGLTVYSSSAIDISGLTEDAEIQVTGSIGATFTASDENAAKVVSCFTNTTAGTKVALTDNGMQLTIVENTVVKEPTKEVFEPWEFEDAEAYCEACDAFVTGWQAWEDTHYSDATALTDSEDTNAHFHIYLETDETYNNGAALITYRNVCFNLNGHTLTAGSTGTYGLSSSKKLNVMDTGTEGAIIGNGASVGQGSAIHANGADAASDYHIYGGTFKRLETNTTAPIVYIGGQGGKITWHDGTVDATGATGYTAVRIDGASGKPAQFIMEKGTIKGAKCAAAGYPGSVYLTQEYSSFTLKDGMITGGAAAGSTTGGNVYINKGTFTMDGGSITDGSSQHGWTGGNVYLTGSATAKFTMNGGTISGGYRADADGNEVNATAGGNVFIYRGTFEMNNGIVQNDTNNAYNGANFHVNYKDADSILNIKGGKVISDGTGSCSIYATTAGSYVNISGGTFSSNTAGYGTVLRLEGGTHKITGGTLTGGTATSAGGTIYVKNANLEIDGTQNNEVWSTVIEGGSAENGGNIAVTGTSVLTIKGGSVTGGTANYGGNIYIDSANVTMTMTGGAVSGGTAKVGPGGNVSVSGTDMEMSGDAKIYGGTATANQAGNVYVNKGKLTMSGTAGIYGGHSGSSSVNKAHNVYIVAGNMEMSDNSYVYGKEQTNANAISLAPSGGINSTLTLKDNTKVMNDPKDPVVSKGSIYLGYTACDDDDLTNDMHANIVIDDSWTGEAYVMMNKSKGELNAAGTATALAWLAIGDTVDGGVDSVNGPVGTGTAFTGNLYYTARTYYTGIIGSTSGNLVLAGHAVVDTTNDTEQWMSMEDAVAAADGIKTMYLKAAANVTLNGETVYIDALKDVKVEGTGTVKGIDPDNKDYKTSTGKINAIGVTLEPEATIDGTRYINVDGTFHAIEMRLTNVTLRANDKCGLYYKASFKCDSTLAAAIDAYGVALNLNAVPDENFWQSNTFTVNEDFKAKYDSSEIANTVNTNSGGVWNIMKSDLEVAENRERLVRHIYANAYILLKGSDTPIMADTENAGTTDGVGYSLYEVMAAVDEKLNTLTNENQVKAVAKFYKTWSSVWSETFTVDGVAYNPVADFASIAAKAAELNV